MNKPKEIQLGQIALIGASQSGKTTLAAGLAKTSDPDFTVGFSNNTTRNYLESRIADISDGRWPEASVGDVDIELCLNTGGGNTSTLTFKEYMGEKIRDRTYVEKIVGKPRGALVLLGPGMDILREAASREEMIANLKGIIDHLRDVRCAAIALVITASDRLATDLEGFKPQFEVVVAEVANYLATSGIQWKRFDVTITGKLKDQKSPSFAAGKENTAREPFVWVMSQMARKADRDARVKRAKRFGCAASLLAGIAAIACGVEYWRESSALGEFEKSVSNAVGRARSQKDEADLNAKTKELLKLISRVETNACFRFSGLGDRHARLVAEWKSEYDRCRARYFEVSMDKRGDCPSSRGSESDCVEFDKMLGDYRPRDVALRTSLTNRWAEVRPRIRAAYDKCQCEELKSVVGKCADEKDALEKLKDKLVKWVVTPQYESARGELLSAVELKLVNRACKDDADAVASALKSMDLESADAESIRRKLKRVSDFAESHAAASENVRVAAKETLGRALESFLNRFAKRFSDKWKPDSRTPPSLCAEDVQFVQDALGVPELKLSGMPISDRVLQILDAEMPNAKKRWNDRQKRSCEEFAAKHADCLAVDVFSEYRKWYEDNEFNPFAALVDGQVERSVSDFLDNYVRQVKEDFLENGSVFESVAGRDDARKGFVAFKSLCCALAANGCGLTNSWVAAFARECANRGDLRTKNWNEALGLSLIITQVEAKVDGGRFGSVRVTQWHDKWADGLLETGKGSEEIANVTEFGGEPGWRTISDKPAKLFLNPWTKSGIWVEATVDVNWKSDPKGSSAFRVFPRHSDYARGYVEHKWKVGTYDCTIRVHCKSEGPDLFEIYERCRKNREGTN